MNITSSTDSHSSIKILPDHVIDQIKAGEVVERPASILKEIIENSVDANAKHISISIEDSGLRLIKIEDDGDGMLQEELPFAFCRHATSKLSRFDQIYDLHSYGFRGEALASISSCSKIFCTSKKENKDAGRIDIEGAKIVYHGDDLRKSRGTSISIRELFYNTPARLKFLKSKSNEKTHIQKIITAFLISHPQVSFSIKFDQGDKQEFKSCSQAKRISDLYFKSQYKSQLLTPLEKSFQGHHVALYLLEGQYLKAIKKKQSIFINKRYITEPFYYQMARRYIESHHGDRNLSFILFIESPLPDTDVNVHPNKTKIKIHHISTITGLLNQVLKEKFKKEKVLPHQESQSSFIEESNHEKIENTQLKLKDLNSSFHKYDEQNLAQEVSFLILNIHLVYDKVNQSLVNFDWFVKDFVENSYRENFPVEESMQTPLLINRQLAQEEISGKTLSFLNELGFELTQLENIFYLNTIPSFLNDFSTDSILSFVEELIKANIFDLEGMSKYLKEIPTPLRLSHLGLYQKVLSQNSYEKYSKKIDYSFLQEIWR